MQVEEISGELGVDLPLVAWRRLQKPPALRASDRGSLRAGSAELGRRSCGASSHTRAASTCAGVVPHGKGVCVWRVYLRLTGVDVVGGLDHSRDEGEKGDFGWNAINAEQGFTEEILVVSRTSKPRGMT